MTKVYFDGVTKEYGSYVQNACVILPEDYTMTQFINAIKDRYQMFKLPSMKKLVSLPDWAY